MFKVSHCSPPPCSSVHLLNLPVSAELSSHVPSPLLCGDENVVSPSGLSLVENFPTKIQIFVTSFSTVLVLVLLSG